MTRKVLFLAVEFDLPLFPNAPHIALMAHGDIGIVAAQEDLVALSDDVIVIVVIVMILIIKSNTFHVCL